MLTVFYDGQCGLCHHTVRFLIRLDPHGKTFRYAPLQGTTAEKMLPPMEDRPDSVAVLAENTLLVRGDAAIKIGQTLGGFWRALAWCFSWLPKRCRDWLYNLIANHRYKIFGTQEEMCPLIPAEQRSFFLP